MQFSRSVSALIIVLASIRIKQVHAGLQSPLRDQYDGYGEDWIFMPDGNGKPQVAILKGFVPDGRNILDGQAINFILFTKSGPVNGTMLSIDDPESLKSSDFSPSRQTKFVTHGWKSSASSSGIANIKNAYVESGDYNVILVDWEPLASSTFYLGPMQNTGRVGAEAGKFIDYLVKETGLKTENVHFIGHSLGAHVAGNTGAAVKSGPLSRVTGLDPALPGFHLLTTTDGRLDATDADFVDVIHSCGGILGWLQPLGDADFYPNGGVAVQPGCCCLTEFTEPPPFLGWSISKALQIIAQVVFAEACSHGRSYVYFTESITTGTGLKATKCDTYDGYISEKCSKNEIVMMGEFVDRSAKGSYFLKTKSVAPYAYVADDSQSHDEVFIGGDESLLHGDIGIDDCDEPGGRGVDENGTPICGTNSV